MAGNQNVTLSLPRELLRRIKRLAAGRETSVSALMTEALARLADEARRYSAARKRALAAGIFDLILQFSQQLTTARQYHGLGAFGSQ